MSDSRQMNLKDLAAAIRRRKVSSVEVTKALIARIDAMAADAQRVRARRGGGCAEIREGRRPRARRRQGERARCTACRSPTRTCTTPRASSPNAARRSARAGSRRRPRPRCERLEAAGSFRLGAVNMVEFAYGPTGHNVHTGNVCNPWSPDCITGGSSSGSGSAVGGAAGAGRARLRHRRLDPHAGAFLRRERLQADQQPRQPRQRDAALVHARHRRAAGADRRGLRDHPFDHRRARSARSDHRAGAEMGRARR